MAKLLGYFSNFNINTGELSSTSTYNSRLMSDGEIVEPSDKLLYVSFYVKPVEDQSGPATLPVALYDVSEVDTNANNAPRLWSGTIEIPDVSVEGWVKKEVNVNLSEHVGKKVQLAFGTVTDTANSFYGRYSSSEGLTWSRPPSGDPMPDPWGGTGSIQNLRFSFHGLMGSIEPEFWGAKTDTFIAGGPSSNIYVSGGQFSGESKEISAVWVYMNSDVGVDDQPTIGLYAGGDGTLSTTTLVESISYDSYSKPVSSTWVRVPLTTPYTVTDGEWLWIGSKGAGSYGLPLSSYPSDFTVSRNITSVIEYDHSPWPETFDNVGNVATFFRAFILEYQPVGYAPTGINLIGIDNTITFGQQNVQITGINLPTTGNVFLRTGTGQEDSYSVTNRTSESCTIPLFNPYNFPYTDKNHSLRLAFDTDDGEMSAPFEFLPVSGMGVFPVLASTFMNTEDSIGYGLVGTVEDTDQFLLPTEYDDNGNIESIVWETDANGNLTGRIASMGGSGNATLQGQHWGANASPNRVTFNITTVVGEVTPEPEVPSEVEITFSGNQDPWYHDDFYQPVPGQIQLVNGEILVDHTDYTQAVYTSRKFSNNQSVEIVASWQNNFGDFGPYYHRSLCLHWLDENRYYALRITGNNNKTTLWLETVGGSGSDVPLMIVDNFDPQTELTGTNDKLKLECITEGSQQTFKFYINDDQVGVDVVKENGIYFDGVPAIGLDSNGTTRRIKISSVRLDGVVAGVGSINQKIGDVEIGSGSTIQVRGAGLTNTSNVSLSSGEVNRNLNFTVINDNLVAVNIANLGNLPFSDINHNHTITVTTN